VTTRELIAAYILMGGIVAAVLYVLCGLAWVIA
jgi:hypothetical protein